MNRKHHDLIVRWAKCREAVVYVLHKGTWAEVQDPHWSAQREYRVIEPEYAEAWDLFLKGELDILVSGRWILATDAPMFQLPPDQYRRAGAHTKERALAEANPDAEIWAKVGVGYTWICTCRPAWHTNSQYKVVLPKYKVLWLLYLRGELQELKQGAWHRVEGVPALDRPLDQYRPEYHAGKYRLAHSRTDAEVWVCGGEYKIWEVTDEPNWQKDLNYRVILPEYAEAWQAYLDGCLQIKGCDGWCDWNPAIVPTFNHGLSHYRRRLTVLKYVKADGTRGELEVSSYEVQNDN